MQPHGRPDPLELLTAIVGAASIDVPAAAAAAAAGASAGIAGAGKRGKGSGSSEVRDGLPTGEVCRDSMSASTLPELPLAATAIFSYSLFISSQRCFRMTLSVFPSNLGGQLVGHRSLRDEIASEAASSVAYSTKAKPRASLVT